MHSDNRTPGDGAGAGAAGAAPRVDFSGNHPDHADVASLLPAHPAATLIVFGPAPERAPHPAPHSAPHPVPPSPPLLMVRRARAMAFAPGAAVFPGGRVDADDWLLGQRLVEDHGLAPDDAAARVAAIRETLEETGLAVGLTAAEAPVPAADLRARLLAGAALSAQLDAHRLTIDPHVLTPFARWRPNHAHARMFDTRFFIAAAPQPLPALSPDGRESSALFWITAADALRDADADRLPIIFPTRRNLERLAQFADFAAALRSAATYPPRRITPFEVVADDGRRHLVIRSDCGYPVTSEPIETALRG